MIRQCRTLAIALAALSVGLNAESVAALAAPGASFDYLYIESNEGGSSGGHAAIRFGSKTYHFQNRNGLLVLDREPTREFLHAYALVNNRTIHSSRVALAAPEARRLRSAFDRRYRIQERQRDTTTALAEDRALLSGWQDPDQGGPPIPALGYFAEPSTAEPPESAALVALRERSAARYGPNFRAERRTHARAQLRVIRSEDPASWPAPPPRHIHDDPPFAYPWARHYLDVASGVGAVDVLEAGSALAADALIAPAGPSHWLDVAEIRRLRAARADLEARLVGLAGSLRADWGRPFLISLARLLALDEALARGRLVVLAVLPEDARRLEHRVLADRLDLVGEMVLAGHEQIEAARLAWLEGGALRERDQARLEEAVTRVHELEQSVREGRGLRLARGRLIPSRAGHTRTRLPRLEDAARIATHLSRVIEREQRHRSAMNDLYHYQLITRNCVAELFHTINAGLGGSVEASDRSLGGHIAGDRGLSFIPFVSALVVDREYRVVGQRVVPSYRELRLAEMRREESAFWVALRESNTLTARSYRRGHQDSYFVFFTDDTLLLRPLFGAVNLVAASFESLWGLLRLPLDRGDTLSSGLEGALMSLPELVFWNIRKGTNDWVAAHPQSLDD